MYRFFVAIDEWVSDEAIRTSTNCLVVSGFTKSVQGARLGDTARVDTAAVQTSIRQRTLIV